MSKRKNKMKLKYFNNKEELRDFAIKVFQFVRNQFTLYEDKASHSLNHTIRVSHTCLELAIKLEAYVDVVIIAALFHDVGRTIEESTGQCHAEMGAEIAGNFLKQESMNIMVEEVEEIIRSHRYSKGIEPSSIEGKILRDADALDALGSMGLYRTISYSVEKGYGLEKALEHFDEKLFKLPDLMRFPITKKLADEKCKILKKFVQDINEELERSRIETLL